MIVYGRDLPTKGKLNDVNEFNITSMTFGELLKYSADEQLTDLRSYIRDLDMMISKDERVGNICLLDSDYVMYLFKLVTINTDLSVTLTISCPECGGQHNIDVKASDIVIQDVSDEYLNVTAIELGGSIIPIRYTTINEFKDFVSNLGRFSDDIRLDVLKLASMLKTRSPLESLDLILNATSDDINLINLLDSEWFNLIEPIPYDCETTNKRGITATFNMSAVNIFRSIINSGSSTKNKVRFREVPTNR